jgi:hypothetical protein
MKKSKLHLGSRRNCKVYLPGIRVVFSLLLKGGLDGFVIKSSQRRDDNDVKNDDRWDRAGGEIMLMIEGSIL